MTFAPVHRIDTWLWRRGFGHPVIMPILRNEILSSAVSLVLGALLFLYTSWLFWFGVGFSIIALTFFGLARFFLRTEFGTYSSALLMKVLLRWAGRLMLTVFLLYTALVLCAAPVTAILAGLVSASFLALVTFAFAART